MGTSWLLRSCFRGDGILRGAGQSRHQAMRRNARVAFVLGGRGRLEGTKRPLIAQYAGQTGGGQSARLAATLGLFRSAATKLAR